MPLSLSRVSSASGFNKAWSAPAPVVALSLNAVRSAAAPRVPSWYEISSDGYVDASLDRAAA